MVHGTFSRRHGAAILSAAAACVFFTIVWHGSVAKSWGNAVGLGFMMGLVILGSLWYAKWPGKRRSDY
jgi:hypothetical protein